MDLVSATNIIMQKVVKHKRMSRSLPYRPSYILGLDLVNPIWHSFLQLKQRLSRGRLGSFPFTALGEGNDMISASLDWRLLYCEALPSLTFYVCTAGKGQKAICGSPLTFTSGLCASGTAGKYITSQSSHTLQSGKRKRIPELRHFPNGWHFLDT